MPNGNPMQQKVLVQEILHKVDPARAHPYPFNCFMLRPPITMTTLAPRATIAQMIVRSWLL